MGSDNLAYQMLVALINISFDSLSQNGRAFLNGDFQGRVEDLVSEIGYEIGEPELCLPYLCDRLLAEYSLMFGKGRFIINADFPLKARKALADDIYFWNREFWDGSVRLLKK